MPTNAFGVARSTDEDPLVPSNPLRFTGEYVDSRSGLYHLRARDYDPRTGRFTAMDPLERLAGDAYASTYAYVDNRATLLVDPTGERGRVRADVIGIFSVPAKRGAVKLYLKGTFCAPRGFPYRPVRTWTKAGLRALDPSGSCSSPLGDTGVSFNFSDPCDTHDVKFKGSLVVRTLEVTA